MLQQRETRQVRSRFNPLLSGEVVSEEGIAMVYVKEDGTTKVKKATGAAGEIFAGVSAASNAPPAYLPFVQEQAVPPSLTIPLVRTPTANQLFVSVAGVQKTVVNVAPADNTKVQLSGSTLVFHADHEGQDAFAQFMYTPSVLEARQIIGDAPIGGLATTPQGVVGCLTDAQLGTNFFDASADWSTTLFAKLAPGGTFTVGTANDHIPNVVVKNAPNAANPFLILSIQVA
jgi:hypothetical protein